MKRRKSSSSSPKSEPSCGDIATGAFPFIESTPKGLYIRVRLAPRASRDAIDGVKNGALRIRITAPPVEGEANRALVSLLSVALNLPRGSFSITPGSLKSKDKKVAVEGVTETALSGLFTKHLKGKT